MWPVIGGALSGGLSLLGSMFSANQSGENVDKQLAFAREQQDWQTQMSNTAYQRSAADMKAAGLNPIAMFSSGSGSPSGTPGQITAPNFSAKQSALGGIGHAAEQVFKSALDAKTMDKMTDEIANLFTARKKMEAETSLTKERTVETEQDVIRKMKEQTGVDWNQLNDATKLELARKFPDTFKTLLGAEFTGQKIAPVVRAGAEGITSAAGVKKLIGPNTVTKPSATLNREALEEYAKRKYGGSND